MLGIMPGVDGCFAYLIKRWGVLAVVKDQERPTGSTENAVNKCLVQ